MFSSFDEWDKTFRYIYGGVLDKSKLIADFRGISKKIFKTQEPLHVDRFLFVLYTYYSLLIKIIASEIVCINLRLPFASFSRLLMQSGNELAQNLVSIEDGTFFKQYFNVKNYIEKGFFSWYLECWEENLEKNIRIILSKVNHYDPKSLFNSGHRVSDLLRHLFQNIVPKRIRHDLGEYYTPQWLAQLAIEEAGYAGDPNQKVLDPGCGSGTFLVEIINVLKHRNLPQMEKAELLAAVLRNVVGFDVNPVAVLTARTNYLLAISDLISPDNTNPIIIPVYLADSILTPTTSGTSELRENVYYVSTMDGTFKISQELVHNDRLPAFFNLVEQSVAANDLPQEFLARLNKQVAVSEEINDIILEFYSAIADLHEAGKAKTWLNIIQNSFAPLLYTDFDYIVGNPPWIKWDFLSPEYKNKLGGLYLQIYKLYSFSGMNAGMGFAHDDISIVFTYVCMDKYLRNGGTLSFVLKQTLYKSIAGREFRKFAIERSAGEVIPVKICKVLDLLDLKPFKDAGSETSIAILEKGTQTTYPVPYFNWRLHGVVEDGMDLDEVRRNTLVEELQAAPDPASGDPTDVWVVTTDEPKPEPGSYEENSYRVRHGVVNDLNSVFFVKILGKTDGDLVITNEQIGKKKVRPIQTTIEKDLVYPIVKPRHVKK
ncbi:MAG TPA: N-6 DNA methylase, partial [Candidatus Lokiarchaeia archaeon]|nr:N-6 DNA methylase [Candidatus Lokiarchaeia archaeon]